MAIVTEEWRWKEEDWFVLYSAPWKKLFGDHGWSIQDFTLLKIEVGRGNTIHYFVKAKKVEKSSGSHFGFTWKYKENAILHNIIYDFISLKGATNQPKVSKQGKYSLPKQGKYSCPSSQGAEKSVWEQTISIILL